MPNRQNQGLEWPEFSASDLARLVFAGQGCPNGHLAMVYQAFLDDSSDAEQKETFVSAGFVAPWREWESFRKPWRKCLMKHGIEYFKTSEMKRLSGQFARFKTSAYPRPTGADAAVAIRDELQSVLPLVRTIKGFAVCFPVALYESEIKPLKEADGGFVAESSLYNRAFESVIFEIAKYVRSKPGRNLVSFVHDEENGQRDLKGLYCNFKKSNQNIAKTMAGFSFLDDKLHSPLQVADMLANQIMNEYSAWQRGNCATPYEPARMKENIFRVVHWNKAAMLAILAANPHLTDNAYKKQRSAPSS